MIFSKVDILLPVGEQVSGGVARRDDQPAARASEVAPAADLHGEAAAHRVRDHVFAHETAKETRRQTRVHVAHLRRRPVPRRVAAHAARAAHLARTHRVLVAAVRAELTQLRRLRLATAQRHRRVRTQQRLEVLALNVAADAERSRVAREEAVQAVELPQAHQVVRQLARHNVLVAARVLVVVGELELDVEERLWAALRRGLLAAVARVEHVAHALLDLRFGEHEIAVRHALQERAEVAHHLRDEPRRHEHAALLVAAANGGAVRARAGRRRRPDGGGEQSAELGLVQARRPGHQQEAEQQVDQRQACLQTSALVARVRLPGSTDCK